MTAGADRTAPGGTDRAPLHVIGELLASKRIGAYRHLTVVAPGVPERFRPGTFVAVSVGSPEGTLLGRRALWIHRVNPVGGYGATLQLVVEPVGPGTDWLAGLAPGARLTVTGPLGRPFALPINAPSDSPHAQHQSQRARPKGPVSCVLIGEEYGAAPLFPLADRLRERGCQVSMIVGARDEAHLLSTLEVKRSARSVTVVTRDGSVGQKGRVADVTAEILRRVEADVVYAVGPVASMHAVAVAAEEHGAWSQTAIEQPLTCATGLCHGCALPVVDETGAPRFARACVDGPVFRGDRVRWGEVGK